MLPMMSRHQGGLAHLPRSQDVTELAVQERAMQIAIRLSFHIGGRIRAKRPAGDVERAHGCAAFKRKAPELARVIVG
jgi:hypothetical protein